MSESEKCKEKSEEVADDWENAGDDAIVASVAERQKQLEQYENKLAVEQEQLKIHQTKATGNEKNRHEVGDGPIRLLRRPRKGDQQKKTDAELEAEAQERAHKALEEREALYQQTRERIFGGEQSSSQQSEPTSSESVSAPPQPHLLSIEKPSAAPRDHLSDVPMKRADQRKNNQRQQQPIPQQPQPPMPPVSLPMMMPPPPPQSHIPWYFNGPPPPYGAPVPLPPSFPLMNIPPGRMHPPMHPPPFYYPMMNQGFPPYDAPRPLIQPPPQNRYYSNIPKDFNRPEGTQRNGNGRYQKPRKEMI